MSEFQEVTLSRPQTVGEAAFQLMAAIDAKGGNPAWPHGGNLMDDRLWHFLQRFAETLSWAQKGTGP